MTTGKMPVPLKIQCNLFESESVSDTLICRSLYGEEIVPIDSIHHQVKPRGSSKFSTDSGELRYVGVSAVQRFDGQPDQAKHFKLSKIHQYLRPRMDVKKTQPSFETTGKPFGEISLVPKIHNPQ